MIHSESESEVYWISIHAVLHTQGDRQKYLHKIMTLYTSLQIEITLIHLTHEMTLLGVNYRNDRIHKSTIQI